MDSVLRMNVNLNIVHTLSKHHNKQTMPILLDNNLVLLVIIKAPKSQDLISKYILIQARTIVSS